MKKISILLMILVLSACQGQPAALEQSDIAMKTVVDSMGRQVEIPDRPQRVACLFTNTGHIITMLGHGDTIVAVSNGLKRDKLLHQIEPDVAEATLVKRGGAVNFEEVLKLDVDLFLMPSDMYQDEGLVRNLDQYRIPYVVTKFDSIEAQMDLVGLMGDIFNEKEEAQAYVSMYEEIVGEVSAITDQIEAEDRPKVYHCLVEATNTVQSNTLPSQWMSLAGGNEVSVGENLAQDKEKYYATLEQIVLWNPEVIFCNEDGVDGYILSKDQWQSIEAVKQDRVYVMPTGISRWGHTTSIETPLAMIWTVKTLYPELTSNLDLKKRTMAFYEDLFEYPLTDDQYEQIIAGRGMRFEKDLSDKE